MLKTSEKIRSESASLARRQRLTNPKEGNDVKTYFLNRE